MPKKLSINTKAEEARERKETQKKEKSSKEQKEKEDQVWDEAAGPKKKSQKKKEEDEARKAEAAAKKLEAKKLAAEVGQGRLERKRLNFTACWTAIVLDCNRLPSVTSRRTDGKNIGMVSEFYYKGWCICSCNCGAPSDVALELFSEMLITPYLLVGTPCDWSTRDCAVMPLECLRSFPKVGPLTDWTVLTTIHHHVGCPNN